MGIRDRARASGGHTGRKGARALLPLEGWRRQPHREVDRGHVQGALRASRLAVRRAPL